MSKANGENLRNRTPQILLNRWHHGTMLIQTTGHILEVEHIFVANRSNWCCTTRTENQCFVESTPISYLLAGVTCVSTAVDILAVPSLLTAAISVVRGLLPTLRFQARSSTFFNHRHPLAGVKNMGHRKLPVLPFPILAHTRCMPTASNRHHTFKLVFRTSPRQKFPPRCLAPPQLLERAAEPSTSPGRAVDAGADSQDTGLHGAVGVSGTAPPKYLPVAYAAARHLQHLHSSPSSRQAGQDCPKLLETPPTPQKNPLSNIFPY